MQALSHNPHLWIDRRLGQLGIDVRISGRHEQMREYLKLLREEIRMTEQFIKEDRGRTKRPPEPLTAN